MLFLDVGELISKFSDWFYKNIGIFVNAIVRYIFLFIDKIIFQLVIQMYKIFEVFCKARFLNGKMIEDFASRLGIILGVVMVFVVSLSFVKLVLDPDKTGEVSPQNVIKKVVISIVMLGVSTFVFETLFEIQRIVVESNIIGKVLLAYSVEDNIQTNDDTTGFGGYLAEELFTAFYHVDSFSDNTDSDVDANKVQKCVVLHSRLRNEIVETGHFTNADECVSDIVTVSDGEITKKMFVMDYNYLLMTGVGIATLYFIYSYAVSVGIRMIQLAFLEIMFPMAAVSYVAPSKDTMFSKWYKVYLSTYIDVFIRIMIISFVAFLISALFESSSSMTDYGFSFWNSIETEGESKTLITIFMILALLSFAKKAPDLLKKILPNMGDSGLSFGVDKDITKSTGQFLGASAAVGSSLVASGAMGLMNMASIRNATSVGDGFKRFGAGLVKAPFKGISSFGKASMAGFRGFGAGGKAGSGFSGLSASLKEQANANRRDFAQYRYGNHWWNDLGDNIGEYTGLPFGIHQREEKMKDLEYIKDLIDKDPRVAKQKKINDDIYDAYVEMRSNQGFKAMSRTDFEKSIEDKTYNEGDITVTSFNGTQKKYTRKDIEDQLSFEKSYANEAMNDLRKKTDVEGTRFNRVEETHGSYKNRGYKGLKDDLKNVKASVDEYKVKHPHQ